MAMGLASAGRATRITFMFAGTNVLMLCGFHGRM